MDKIMTKMMTFCLLLAATSSPVLTGEWEVSVEKSLDALVSSCVVVPCSFTPPRKNIQTSRLRGIWLLSDKENQRIYHEDDSEVMENFRGRTKIGPLIEKNCTLEMTKVKDHDNGPFCFRVEVVEMNKSVSDAFTFHDCVTLTMLSHPPKPELTPSKEAIQDQPYTITCSVTHTCPSHPPNLTWSRGTGNEVSRNLHPGYWEVMSILTFIPSEKDDHSDITCMAKFNGGRTSSSTLKLYLKRVKNYNYIIIPSAVGIVTTLIFGVLCLLMVKKYKRRITELQGQSGSILNRLSRLSRRIRFDDPGSSCSDQRPTKANSKSCNNQKISKPYFPSPKNQRKSSNYNKDLDDCDDYMNTADLNIYGNL